MSSSSHYAHSRPLTVAIPRSAFATGPYCPRRPNLTEILANTAPPPWTLSAFMAYLSQNHCLETLEFTMDASRYRKHYNKMIARSPQAQISPVSEECKYVKMLWRRLLEAYIAPNGPREVNLPSDVRDRILSQSDLYSPPPPDTLTPAVEKVYELMEESVLVPFLNSLCPQTAHPDSAYDTSDENFHSHTRSYDER
ncbi:regulator of G protein signaling superfamily, partial [Patellaria atrata CBS 101060]